MAASTIRAECGRSAARWLIIVPSVRQIHIFTIKKQHLDNCTNLIHAYWTLGVLKHSSKHIRFITFIFPHRLNVEGLVHGLHWVTMAELGGRRAGRTIVQHQGPGGNINIQ